MATLTSNKVDFKAKKITGNKETHYIMIKGSIYQENTMILSMYTPNNRASKDMKPKQKELKEEMTTLYNLQLQQPPQCRSSIWATSRTTRWNINQDIGN